RRRADAPMRRARRRRAARGADAAGGRLTAHASFQRSAGFRPIWPRVSRSGRGMTPTDQPDESINANIKEGLDDSQVSLALVATRMCRLLGGATAPLFVIAAFLTHGAGRWVLLALTVLLVLGALVKVDERAIRRPIYSVHTMFLSAVVIVLWSWLAPQATVLLAVNVVAGVMYMAMALERPYSQIAIGTNAVSYVVAQAAFGARG